MGKRIFYIFLLVLTLKLSYFLFYKVCYTNFAEARVEWKRDLITLFFNSDSGWYERIATTGYPKIDKPEEIGHAEGGNYYQTEWAFFPVYPLTVKAVMWLTGLDFNHAAFPLSLLYCFFCFVSFFFLNIKVFGTSEEKAFFRTFVFALLPFNYYFSMYYTEALFFTLMAGSFIMIKENKLWALSLLLIPLAVIRANGLVICLPLYLYFLETQGKTLFKLDGPTFLKSFYFITAPLAFGAYCLYQKHMTGMYFAFSAAQAGWYRESMLPFLSLFRSGDFASQFNSVYVLLYVAVIILCRKKFPPSLNVLLWISIILPLCSGSTIAVQRYIVPIFPFTIIICDALEKINLKKLVWPSLLVLHFVTFYLWIISHPLSM
jgi:hypothetical protein